MFKSICTIVYYALIHILSIYIYTYIIYKGMIVAWGFGVVAIYFLVVQFKYDGLDGVCGCLLPPVVGGGGSGGFRCCVWV